MTLPSGIPSDSTRIASSHCKCWSHLHKKCETIANNFYLCELLLPPITSLPPIQAENIHIYLPRVTKSLKKQLEHVLTGSLRGTCGILDFC